MSKKEIASYRFPPLVPATGTESPDTKPGDYYVTIREGRRFAYALGPFRDDHAAALARVDEVRAYIESQNYPRSPWYAYGTARLSHDPANPAGKLNEILNAEIAA